MKIAQAHASKIRAPKLPMSWIDAQRRPPTHEATGKMARQPTPKQRLLARATLGWTRAEQALISELGHEAYLERQLDPDALDVAPLEDALHEALPTLSMTPYELYSTYEDDPLTPAFELLIATLYRSIYSPRQLHERMVVFWTDHFNIDLFSDFANYLKPADDRDVIRPHALGKFPDLLRASAHSPAMLTYLTNDTNVKDHPNENYARELLELHTLGADRGYDQSDVIEVARALTGWTVKGFEFAAELGQFHFAAEAHDRGPKNLLGRAVAAGGGLRDGEILLTVLARHANTADFISRKMLRYMWGYDPPQSMVDKVAETYLDTGGDIAEMLRVILKPAWMATATAKLKRPYHHLVSALRALEANVEDPFQLIGMLFTAGQLPFTWGPPNGFPDAEGFWAGFVLPRWNFSTTAFQLEPDLGAAATLDIPALDPERNSALTRAGIRGRLNRQLMGGRMSGATKTAIRDYLANVPLSQQSVVEAIGLGVASPDFQYY